MSSAHDCQPYHYYLPNGKKSYHNNITYLFEYHSSFYFQFYRSYFILPLIKYFVRSGIFTDAFIWTPEY